MVFKTAEWVGDLPFDPPAKTLVGDFLFNQSWPGQVPGADANGTLVCASTGASLSMQVVRERVDFLARSLCQQLKWQPNEGSPAQKVIGIFSVNAVRIPLVL